jgi:hypothetical protein
MISFPSIELDEKELFEAAEASFFQCARNMLEESIDSYKETFGGFGVEDLNVALAQVQCSWFNHNQDLVYFDQSTKFHILVKLYVYGLDEDSETEQLAGYTYVLNQSRELVDDFLV